MRNDDIWGIDAGYLDPVDRDEYERVRRDAELEVLDAADPPRKRGVTVNASHLDALGGT